MGKKIEILDASENVGFQKIHEAINTCIGTDYTAWMKATWPNVNGNGKFRIWFPKLAEVKKGEVVSAAFDCLNTLSEDWNEIIYDDLKNAQWDMTKKYSGYDIIFAKDPDGGDYLFRGVYIRDVEKSKPNHDVSKRIATRVRLIGDPVTDIELLDSVSADSYKGINSPVMPKSKYIDESGTIHYICGKCSNDFKSARRCPECGQLVKEM